jgi:pyruvate, water dikinase
VTDSGAVRWFSQLTVRDWPVAGDKAANLGELSGAGFPVPPGFVVSAWTYLQTMERNGLRENLRRSVAKADTDDPGALADLAASLAKEIRDCELLPETTELIVAACRRLGDVPVAVRSSVLSEDAGGVSFPGMGDTFTNVQGESEVLSCLRECWASAWGARAIAYRAGRQIAAEPAIAVVVQRMVQSERSGTMFSSDLGTGDGTRIVIEAALGLGEVVVAGRLVPDTYLLDRLGPRLLHVRVGYKDHKIVCGRDGHDVRVELGADQATRRVLHDEEAVQLAELALRVEQHYGSAQNVEWAIEGGQLYLLQSRPITRARESGAASAGDQPTRIRGRLVAGLGAAPGLASGAVRILSSPDQGDRFRDGEVLVTAMMSADWMPILRRASALVSDGSGVTCHAAIVSRELGIPCVVGARAATRILHEGQQVSVDGGRGVVEDRPAATSAGPTSPLRTKPGEPETSELTGSRLDVNLAEPAGAQMLHTMV